MSKSLGTGVDPLDLMEQYGADGMRFGLMLQTTGSQDIKFAEEKLLSLAQLREQDLEREPVRADEPRRLRARRARRPRPSPTRGSSRGSPTLAERASTSGLRRVRVRRRRRARCTTSSGASSATGTSSWRRRASPRAGEARLAGAAQPRVRARPRAAAAAPDDAVRHRGDLAPAALGRRRAARSRSWSPRGRPGLAALGATPDAEASVRIVQEVVTRGPRRARALPGRAADAGRRDREGGRRGGARARERGGATSARSPASSTLVDRRRRREAAARRRRGGRRRRAVRAARGARRLRRRSARGSRKELDARASRPRASSTRKLGNEGFLAKAAPEVIEKDRATAAELAGDGREAHRAARRARRGSAWRRDLRRGRRARSTRALRFGINPSLDGIRALTDALGRPQDACACVQVTGTNGKTSVTRMTAAHPRRARLRAGRVHEPAPRGATPSASRSTARRWPRRTSRARCDAALRRRRASRAATLTEFELLTAAALWLFRELRRGVGVPRGRDGRALGRHAVVVARGRRRHRRRRSTTPSASATTRRGDRRGQGAHHQAGRRRRPRARHGRGRRRSCAPRAAEVGRAGRARGARTAATSASRSSRAPDAPGRHDSSSTSAARLGRLPRPRAARAVVPGAQRRGRGRGRGGRARRARSTRTRCARRSRAMRFPGRFELVRDDPPLVLDGAHNPQAAAVLADAIREAFGEARARARPRRARRQGRRGHRRGARARRGAVRGDGAGHSPRARPAAGLAALVERVDRAPAATASSVAEALSAVRDEAAVVTGSLYTVGEAQGAAREPVTPRLAGSCSFGYKTARATAGASARIPVSLRAHAQCPPPAGAKEMR